MRVPRAVSTRPLLAWLLSTSALLGPGLAGCGTIVFGDPLDPIVDAGPDLQDAEPGLDALPDAGPNLPDLGPQDLGCEAVQPGPFPTSWPFEPTAAAYQEHFYPIAEAARQHCGTAACHAPERNQAPLIPSGVSSIPTYIDQAINQLWASVPLQERTWQTQPGQMRTAMVRPLLWAHASQPNGLGAVPRLDMLDPPTFRALQDFVALVESCQWAPVFANPPEQPLECRPDAGGPPPDAGTPDLGSDEDAGTDPDGGEGDAAEPADAEAPDAGPPDTGASAVLCYCPLPDIDVSHCRVP